MRIFCIALVLSFAAVPAWANARITVLMDILKTAEVVEILRSEGLSYADTLDTDMLDGQGGAVWQAQVVQIYDADRMNEALRAALTVGLTDSEITAAIKFFGSEGGSAIIDLENAARLAIADPIVEQAARDIYIARSVDDPLVITVSEYIAANDLLERNVSSAMSSNYQFFKGLSDGKFLVQSEGAILDEVWAQQDDIRSDTEEWLNGFLMMAYQPLSGDVMQEYIQYSQSDAGQALNAALFDGFGVVYRDVSYALGRAIALNATGDEI